MRWTTGRLATWVALLVTAPLAGWSEPQTPASERIFATEDSLRVYVAPETTHVVARHMALSEIIRKAQEGERHKYDGIQTLAFDRIVKVTLAYGDSSHKGKTRCIESVARVYYRDPGEWSEVPLRETRYEIDANGERKPWNEKDEKIQIEAGDSDESGRQLSELPPYLEETEKFDFRILHRSLRPDQVLYEIGFEPRSDFDILPGGRVWLLTNGYQIVREEYHLKNVPFPWFLKSIGLLTRDWKQVEGRWLTQRVTARAHLRSGVGLGLVDVPRTVEAVVLFDNYRIDMPLDAALFERHRR